jgi:hypothetical protein
MERAPSRRRRLLSWLPSVVLLLIIGGFAVAAVGVNNSWWVDPEPTAAPDQTAPGGSSVFTDAGVDYLRRTGLVVVRMDGEALPAEVLGLAPDGERTVTVDRPLMVQAFGSAGALAVDEASAVTLRTAGGELVGIDVLVDGGDFTAAHAELAAVADLYGWEAEEVAGVVEQIAEAKRADPDSPATATVGPGEKVGLFVSATLIAAGGAQLVYTAERPAP